MITICAYCQHEAREGKGSGCIEYLSHHDSKPQISHGVCKRHHAEEVAKWQRRLESESQG